MTWNGADWLKAQRKLRGLRQADLAKEVGVVPGWISRLEGGATPGDDTLKALERFFGSSPTEHEEAPPRSVTDEAGLSSLVDVLRDLVTEVRTIRQTLPSRDDWARTLVAAYDSGDSGTEEPPSPSPELEQALASQEESEPVSTRQSDGPDGDD